MKYRLLIKRARGRYMIQRKDIPTYLKYEQKLKIEAKNPIEAIEKYRKRQLKKATTNEIVKVINKKGKILKQRSFTERQLTSYKWS